MLSYILDKLIIYSPPIALYFFILVIVIFIVWKISKFYFETDKTNKTIPEINTSLKKIQTGLNILNNVLLEKNVISQSYYSEENSPRALNDLGKKLYEQSQAGELFEEIKNDLVKELEENKSIDSLLELERESLNVLLRKRDDKNFKNIQDFAFQHPSFEGNVLTYTDILFMMALKLRNLYSEKHPELGSIDISRDDSVPAD